MTKFDQPTVFQNITETLSGFGISDDQEGVLEMITDLTNTMLKLYKSATPVVAPATTKTGKGRGSDYTRFISMISVNKDKISGVEVNIKPRFTSQSKSKIIYESNQSAFERDEPITIGELREIINEVVTNHDSKTNRMTENAIFWNLLDDDDRHKVAEACS